MMESLLQIGMIILLFVFLRIVFKNYLPHVFFKYIWILCAIKVWIPIAISLPRGIVQASKLYKVYQPEALNIQSISTTPNLLYFLWVSVSILLFVFYVRQYWCIKQIVDCAIPLDKDTYESDQISSPFAFGICNYKVVVPKNMDKETLSYVIRHENIHNKYFDNGWKLFVLLTCCVFWFHPMVWVLRYALNVDSEIVCDQRVVQTLSKGERRNYAQAILVCASNKVNLTSSCCSQFSSRYYKERIKNIMKYKKTKAITLVLSCVLAGGIITVCANNNEVYTGDAQTSQPTPEGETVLTQEEKFEQLSKCKTGKEYVEMYMILFPNAEMIYRFSDDFSETSLPFE